MAALTVFIHALRSAGIATWLTWRAGLGVAQRLFQRDPLTRAGLALAVARFVWVPLPTLGILAALIGVIAGVLSARALGLYNAELLVLTALVDALLRQVLPLIAGVFASGSVAVELTSRIGAMSLSREIDALESMGHDPVPFVLGPPVIAVLAAAPLHMVLAAAAAIGSAGIVLHASAKVPWYLIGQVALSAAAARALLAGIAKAVVFAWLAFAVGATIGSAGARTPGDIGRTAGRAFTTCLVAIFAVAAVWVALA